MNRKRDGQSLFVLASLLFGIKTYMMYRFMFGLQLDNGLEEILLFINPLVSAYLVFSLSVLFEAKKRQMALIRYATIIGTLILYFNLVFYRSFTDFITIPQLFQLSNMGDLGSSILSLMKPYDLLLILDVGLIWFLSRNEKMAVSFNKKEKTTAIAVAIMLLFGNLILAEIERPQLFTRGFDRQYIIKNVGLFNYHIYDVIVNSKVSSQRVFADKSELSDIKDYVETIRTDEKTDMLGAAKGKNVIFISSESMQNFVINREVNGQEITPFLNSLVEDEDTFYFENFYQQTMQGRTSDSEFLVENSLYPLPRGAVFFTNGQNKYNAMPQLLKDQGYYTSVFHANNKSFWNRNQMYDNIGYDYFYGQDSYQITEQNSVGWGLKDKAFFKQSIKYLQSLDQPFYTKFISLTNHFPFELGEEDRSIEPYDSGSKTLNNYFPTVRYADEAFEQFFNQLKDAGLYEDSIIVIMGDHYGISENHYNALSGYLGKDEITPYDDINLQRVPLFIHIPGSGKGKVMSEVAGQIDVKPTLLNLLGVENRNDIYFGNDLFAKDRKGYVALRNGDFVSDDYISTAGICYDRESGEPLSDGSGIGDSRENPCQPIQEKVKKELSYSDSIIYGDLFRFTNFEE
ncbi:LTA synthase family protein [Aquibacillus salsiterrae]|uniref:LTA synthase family protein n=1 Tax=Aquibacillus salsiterrae TaxID=2950439 RepID=A0A9X3WDK5_9BACI|nr:LTA synthase family protein [Aquibacillus salsiterrae]MDC3416763.1 LTA synthase family protein [Aquibacillus salsiterrae]